MTVRPEMGKAEAPGAGAASPAPSPPVAPIVALLPGQGVLRVEKLTVGYKAPVLKDVSFECGAGSFISILGPNGVGKTTLLRTISRHLKPLAGKVFVLGKAIGSYRATDLARIVSVVMTDKAAPPLLQVLEFVGLGRYPHTGFMGKLTDRDLRIVTKSLADVKAEYLAGRFIDQLSDGERQKVTLARALAQEPRLMLLDEPTSHLDLKHRMEIMGILRALCRLKQLTVLAAVHDVDVAAKVSDQVLALKGGRLEKFGPPHKVLTSKFVAHLYDFEKAGYSNLLGGIEIRGDGQAGRAFVVAGEDKGAQAFRYLSKHGYRVSAGILGRTDLDSYVAGALGCEVFTPAKPGFEGAALESLRGADFVVDAVSANCPGEGAPGGAPAPDPPDPAKGEGTQGDPAAPRDGPQETLCAPNRALLQEAARLGLRVITLGPNGEISPLVDALDEMERLKRAAPMGLPPEAGGAIGPDPQDAADAGLRGA
ncbi:MAG: ABC transporter ATP-binding protein [Deltaproteobacteria bacterium]|jgi:iron complex transport system ATP-binding protein|nr:ABC transporter ATP-binding protein [Deltaproteobacteria bacterium]